jgi:hypothetical protein
MIQVDVHLDLHDLPADHHDHDHLAATAVKGMEKVEETSSQQMV